MLPKGSATGSDSRSTAALLLLDVAGARSYMKDLHQSYTKLLRERTAMHDTISRLQRRLALALQVRGCERWQFTPSHGGAMHQSSRFMLLLAWRCPQVEM